MTKHVAAKPLQQKLRERITSAFRGYEYLSAVNQAIDLNSRLNGDALTILPVASEYKEDICNCLYIAGEYNGQDEIIYRDIILEFK